jgi:hypothetical protein
MYMHTLSSNSAQPSLSFFPACHVSQLFLVCTPAPYHAQQQQQKSEGIVSEQELNKAAVKPTKKESKRKAKEGSNNKEGSESANLPFVRCVY